jgi:hypothetical protein
VKNQFAIKWVSLIAKDGIHYYGINQVCWVFLLKKTKNDVSKFEKKIYEMAKSE